MYKLGLISLVLICQFRFFTLYIIKKKKTKAQFESIFVVRVLKFGALFF